MAAYTHLYEVLLDRSRRLPDSPILGVADGLAWKVITTRDLLRQTEVLAAELQAKGVAEGDRIILWTPNHPRAVAFLFAIWRLGAAAVPFDKEMNPAAAERIVAGIEPKLVLTGHGEIPPWCPTAVPWWEPGAEGGPGAPLQGNALWNPRYSPSNLDPPTTGYGRYSNAPRSGA